MIVRRAKLSHDPNNIKWTRDTGGFGHKILTAQGWQPGEILGAKNASHAEFHTAANASHIRVVVKDDNLGLGAKKGKGLADSECTGLDVFQSLLGRLNGKKEDELAKKQRSREEVKRAIHTGKRWGSIIFVRGGYLVGDKIQELVEKEEDRAQKLASDTFGADTHFAGKSDSNRSSSSEALKILHTKQIKKKKRKELLIADESIITNLETPDPALDDVQSDQNSTLDANDEVLQFPPKKSRKKRKGLADIVEAPSSQGETGKSESGIKRKRKAKTDSKHAKGNLSKIQVYSPQSIHSTPTSQSGSSTPSALIGGRHAVRSRNIAQKRLAVLDTASLNQVSKQFSVHYLDYD